MPATLTIDFKQAAVQRFPIRMPASQIGLGSGAMALRRKWTRSRYQFELAGANLGREEKDRLESFLKFHQSDVPFWFDGADFGDIQHKQLFGLGDGSQQDFFLPNDHIINGTVTVFEDGIVQAGVTITNDTGLAQFSVAPSTDERLEATYRCRYKVFILTGTVEVERVSYNRYALSCTLGEFTGG